MKTFELMVDLPYPVSPFNLDRRRSGAAVFTREGSPFRFLKTYMTGGETRIVGEVDGGRVVDYRADGRIDLRTDSPLDLMVRETTAPVPAAIERFMVLRPRSGTFVRLTREQAESAEFAEGTETPVVRWVFHFRYVDSVSSTARYTFGVEVPTSIRHLPLPQNLVVTFEQGFSAEFYKKADAPLGIPQVSVRIEFDWMEPREEAIEEAMAGVEANREQTRREQFEEELTVLINKYNREAGSDTPDFILARYLVGCLDAFDGASRANSTWHGHDAPAVEVDSPASIELLVVQKGQLFRKGDHGPIMMVRRVVGDVAELRWVDDEGRQRGELVDCDALLRDWDWRLVGES